MSEKTAKAQVLEKSGKAGKLLEKASKSQSKTSKSEGKATKGQGKSSKGQEKPTKVQSKSPKASVKASKTLEKSPKVQEKTPKSQNKASKVKDKTPKNIEKISKAHDTQEKVAAIHENPPKPQAKLPKSQERYAPVSLENKSGLNKEKKQLEQSANTSTDPGEWTTGGTSTKYTTDVVLPQSKVKQIMKSSPGIDQVGTDVVFLLTKATELFIESLISSAHGASKDKKHVQYKHLAEAVQRQPNFSFLQDIIPHKMTARAALAEMAKQKELDDKELFE